MTGKQLKPTVKMDTLDVEAAFAHPEGTIIELPDGSLFRISYARNSRNKRTVRMTKRTANGLALKAGEEQHRFVKDAPKVWKVGFSVR